MMKRMNAAFITIKRFTWSCLNQATAEATDPHSVGFGDAAQAEYYALVVHCSNMGITQGFAHRVDPSGMGITCR